jgi:hypothetical protein
MNGCPYGLRRIDAATGFWFEGKKMKGFRSKFLTANSAQVQASAPAPQTAGQPAEPKLTRRQRRMNATLSRQLNKSIKKASDLGRPISLRTDASGRLKAVMGKPKKEDRGPQPGEVIREVTGNDLPEFPSAPAFPPSPPPHVHGADCQHEGNIFDAADNLVRETLGEAER